MDPGCYGYVIALWAAIPMLVLSTGLCTGGGLSAWVSWWCPSVFWTRIAWLPDGWVWAEMEVSVGAIWEAALHEAQPMPRLSLLLLYLIKPDLI